MRLDVGMLESEILLVICAFFHPQFFQLLQSTSL